MASLWDLSSEEEIHHFKNESLGMAFLHLCHLALSHGIPLEKVAKKIRCLGMGRGQVPGSHGRPPLLPYLPSALSQYLLYAGVEATTVNKPDKNHSPSGAHIW